jgi:radical SAM enzyme (rSAM/lipoprotein system)
LHPDISPVITAAHLGLKKRIALDLYAAKRMIDSFTHDLRYLFWECTLRCNCACLHCGSDCGRDTATPDMPLADFLRVLDSVTKELDSRTIVVCITGGEPLMRSDLAVAGEEISRRGFAWGFVTNGVLLTPGRFRELRKAGLSSVAISLDGLEADHTWFRGNASSYTKAVQAISLAVTGAEKDGRFSFDVVTCVNRRNFVHLDLLKRRLVELGVQKWRLVSIFPKGRAALNQDLKLTHGQLRGLMEFIRTTRREKKIAASYGCEGFLGGYEMEVRDTPFFCRAGINIGSVLADGSISACPSLRADYIQGSIYKDEFLDVWDNKFAVMRDRGWARTGACRACRSWGYCRGNGLHLRDEKSGGLLFCNYLALALDDESPDRSAQTL